MLQGVRVEGTMEGELSVFEGDVAWSGSLSAKVTFAPEQDGADLQSVLQRRVCERRVALGRPRDRGERALWERARPGRVRRR